MLWEEKRNPSGSRAWYNRNSQDTRLSVDYIMQVWYGITGTEEEIVRAIQQLPIVKKQIIYKTLKRLRNRGLIEYTRGEIKAYFYRYDIKNLKTGQMIPLKRLITY